MTFKLLFVTIVVFGFSLVQATGLDLDKLLKDVPVNERFNFLKYHLERGFQLKTKYNPDFGKNYTDDVSKDIYEYFIDNHQITDKSEVSALKKKICFPNGKCIDIDDPSVHP